MNANGLGRFEERGFDSVVCPRPRHVGLFSSSAHDHVSISRWPTNSCYQTDMADSIAGTEQLLDMILTKGGYRAEEKGSNHVASSPPPFFCGSPPSRASNPVIQYAQFKDEKQLPPLSSTPSPSSRIAGGGGCVRLKFGQKPAAARIECFDCLGRQRHSNCSISAMA